MRISTLFSTFASLSYLLVDAAHTSGTFLRINGIQSNPKLNGCYAVVLDNSHLQDSSGRSGVLALLDEKILSFDPYSSDAFSPVDYFSKISVNNANLHSFGWNNPEVLSVEEVLNNTQRIENTNLAGFEVLNFNSFRTQEINFEQRVVLNRIVQFLWKLCSNQPERFLTLALTQSRARLIGAWILQNYHFSAMQYVADKKPEMTSCLERAWEGIGVWQA